MKKHIISFFLILLINSISYASDVVEINVTGSISTSTCNIVHNKELYLGTWQASSKTGIGSGVNSTSTPVLYSIDFDCPPNLPIKLGLDGNQYDTADDYYIGLEKSDNSAEGVVVVIHYLQAGSWISVRYGDPRLVVSSTVDGVNTIQFRSFYKQVSSTIKPGVANTTVTLVVSYE